MKAAGLSVDWSSALRANTVHDQCAFRSLPYPSISLLTGKLRVHTAPGNQNRALRRQFLATHAQNRLPWASNSTLVSFQNT